MKISRFLAAALAAFFIASSASAQNAGTVTNHAFVIGKGAGTTGYTSLLCTSAQLAVGQSAADPICRTLSGDMTIDASGVTAIGATKVTSAMLNADVFSTAHSWAGQQTFVAPILGTPASGTLTNATGLPISTGVSGLGTGIAAFLATPSSANLRTALTDEVGTGAAYFVGGALGTPASGTLTNATGLPVGGIAAIGANTLVGNSTSSSASPTAVSMPSCGSANQAINWTSGTGPGCVTIIGGNAVGQLTPGGRLTLQTGFPVMNTSQSAKTTIFYTPYIGNYVPIYDGTNMIPTVFTELSVATTDTTKSPAAIGVSKINDWFVWSDAGTLRLGHGPDWTSDTVRSAGTALTMVNGILMNNASITNGPAASRGTYVGTTRSNASSQLDWIFGSLASGGGAGWFGVWNCYNRVPVLSMIADSTATWNYASTTVRAANGSATIRHSYVMGLAEDPIDASYAALGNGTAGTVGAVSGVGHDTTSGFSGAVGDTSNSATAVIPGRFITIDLGFHFVSANEAASASSTVTFLGTSGFGAQSGLFFQGRM